MRGGIYLSLLSVALMLPGLHCGHNTATIQKDVTSIFSTGALTLFEDPVPSIISNPQKLNAEGISTSGKRVTCIILAVV